MDKQIRILAADDNPIEAMLWTKIFAEKYLVDFVVNGKELVTSNWRKADIIFTDINMPEMDGIKAATIIRSKPKGKQIPIIGITANSKGDIKERCLTAGMNDIFQKPLLIETIDQLINQYVI